MCLKGVHLGSCWIESGRLRLISAEKEVTGSVEFELCLSEKLDLMIEKLCVCVCGGVCRCVCVCVC